MAPLAAAAGLMMSGVPSARAATVTAAIAVIQPTTGNSVSGKVVFTQVDGGVKVVADVSGLPSGKHGFHIHEYGDISDAAKAMSTGGHYDPEGTHRHALVDADHPDGMAHHAGDMGNLVADDSGNAHLEMILMGVTLMGPTDPIVGRAVIIHAKPDDGGQPTGNAGGRIGFGVIGIAKGPSLPATATFEKVTSGEDSGLYVLNLKNESSAPLKVSATIISSVTFHANSKTRALSDHVIDAGDTWTIDHLAAADKVTISADGFASLEVAAP